MGFDLDLMREIGKRAGFTPEFQNVAFDGIIPGLATTYDAVPRRSPPPEAREKKVDFSDPHSTLTSRHGPERLPHLVGDDIGDGTVGATRHHRN